MAYVLPQGVEVVDLTDDQEQLDGLVVDVDGAGSPQDAKQHGQGPPAPWELLYDNANRLIDFIDFDQDVAPAIVEPGGLPYFLMDPMPGAGGLFGLDDGTPIVPNEIRPAASSGTVQPDLPKDGDDLSSTLTKEECLEKVLLIFPNIDPEYVYKLWEKYKQNHNADRQPFNTHEKLVDEIIAEPHYPKRPKGKQPDRKRKRAASDEDEVREEKFRRYEVRERPRGGVQNMRLIGSMLKAEFPEMTQTYIKSALMQHTHLFQTYIALAQEKDSPRAGTPVFGHGRPTHGLANAEVIAANGSRLDLVDELKAARDKVAMTREERAAKLVAELKLKQEEEANLRLAIAAGKISECQACFEELPMNRQIHCSGEEPHFTCLSCAETYIKTEVGESRCRVLCTAGCGAGFEPAQLNLVPNKQLLEKLAQLQQEKDIRDAGLEDLEECPFCDYKAILPPIEEDFEFRCANPECEKVSCRRCKAVSHVPISCEQHAKDHRLNNRHRLEEAMTAALIRSCNTCKKQYIKDVGCNKMTCPSCGTRQCYVCSETVTSYDHFDDGRGVGRSSTNGANKRCPLQDNVEERHARDVREAEAATRAQILAENPEVTEADLEITHSDAVKRKAPKSRLPLQVPPMPPHLLRFLDAQLPDQPRRHLLVNRMMRVRAAALRPAQMQFGGDAAMDARIPRQVPFPGGDEHFENHREPPVVVNRVQAAQLQPDDLMGPMPDLHVMPNNEAVEEFDFDYPELYPLPLLQPQPADAGLAHERDAAASPPPVPGRARREETDPVRAQDTPASPALGVELHRYPHGIEPWHQHHPHMPLFGVPVPPQTGGALSPFGIAQYPMQYPRGLNEAFYYGMFPTQPAQNHHDLQTAMYGFDQAHTGHAVAEAGHDPLQAAIPQALNQQWAMPRTISAPFFGYHIQ